MIPTSAQHPSLHHCRRLFLSDFEVNMSIGVHDFEKKGEQRVIVNVDLYVPLQNNTPKSDDLAEVLDYNFIRQTITNSIAGGHIHLQETLCDEIAARVLAHPLVFAARVSIEKPDAYPDCKSVGVEIFKMKSN